MKKIFSFLLLATIVFATYSQETVSWGAEVIDVSSEYSPYEYSAIQALNRPNVSPQGGASPNAWRPKKTDSEEFIMVSFATPIYAQQIAIAESENPGAVKAVYGYDKEYNEYTLFELTPRELPIPSRLLNLFFEMTPYKIYAIRVVLDATVSEGYNAIDAIGISTSNIPINVLINMARGVNENIDAERLSSNVNSGYIEHSPIISPDGQRLYFSRQYHPENIGGVDDAEDIWVAELDPETGEWLPAKNVGAPLNTEGPNFISSISMVGEKEIIILGNKYGKKGRMYSGVSISTRDGDTFSKPVSVEMEDEYNYAPNTDFFLTAEGKVMLLSAERDDSFGARDLYVSFMKKDSTWSAPKNLGKVINTTGEEESPFMAIDGKTLYFSSDGRKGYGGADIYVSFKQDNTWLKWSEPVNLGEGINKEGNDEYFSIPSTGKNLYFTRGEKGEDTDIFRFKVEDFLTDLSSPLASSVSHLLQNITPDSATAQELVTIKGKIIDAKTGEPMADVVVILLKQPDAVEVDRARTAADGSYVFVVPANAEYTLSGEVDGFMSQNENIQVASATDTVEQNLTMVPIESGEQIALNNILFDFNKAILKSSSYTELDQVLSYMVSGKIQNILLKGHTDSSGPSAYNMKLSSMRAEAVMQYLMKKGIPADRISYKAFGETEPIATNETLEGRKKNRRVELKIEK